MKLRLLTTLVAAVIGVATVAALTSSGKSIHRPGERASAAIEQRRWEARHREALRILKLPIGRRGNMLGRAGIVGRSALGHEIRVTQFGDPSLSKLLVFGCIHGTECAAQAIEPVNGCPVPGANIYKVANLNPDGYALGTRTNGRGVDLNRNFPSGWKPIGTRGSPQFSGPHPFSEPETRLAAHLIRWLRPEVTIWFHQWSGPAMVRAWGQSVPMARRYARLAGIEFRRLPWLAGTAPNWQNDRFPGTSSFVVELPSGSVTGELAGANSSAMVKLAQRIARRG
jgi:protein MpaA